MIFKRLWKFFLFLFLIILIIFNWGEISWVFNYQVVSELVSDFFKLDKEKVNPEIVIPNNLPSQEEKKEEYYEKENKIEIPKIGIEAPLLLSTSSAETEIERLLAFGVVHFPDSVLPGESGQTIILGHSAPPGWPKIKYDWIFTELNNLTEGDEIYIFFNNKKYEYRVKRKVFLERGEDISDPLTNNKNVLILISCWPPGKDIRRIAVEATIE